MTNTTIEKNCLLREVCKAAGDPSACTRICPHYIRMHGHKGEGGRVGAADIPRDYRNITVSSSPIRQAQPVVYRQIDAYVRTFARQFDQNGPRIKSLYLYSDATGTGKTTTACAILNEYLVCHYVGSLQRGVNPEPRPIYFLNFNQWQSRFNAANRKHVDEIQAQEASRIYYGMLDSAKAASLLVIDDIGVRDASEAFRGDAHDLIDHRVGNRMPTVYTSNVTVDELARVYDRRLWDRVRDMTGVIPFDGESKRGMRREDR